MMEKIKAVQYDANGITLALTYGPDTETSGWHLDGSDGSHHEEPAMGAMIEHIRANYGWPLPSKSVD